MSDHRGAALGLPASHPGTPVGRGDFGPAPIGWWDWWRTPPLPAMGPDTLVQLRGMMEKITREIDAQRERDRAQRERTERELADAVARWRVLCELDMATVETEVQRPTREDPTARWAETYRANRLLWPLSPEDV